MSSMPLVMPDVIVGLSLLLMIISVQHWLGFPDKGLFTILLGHALLGTQRMRRWWSLLVCVKWMEN